LARNRLEALQSTQGDAVNCDTQQSVDAALAACLVRLFALTCPLPSTERLRDVLTQWRRELQHVLVESDASEHLRAQLDELGARLLAAARQRDDAERARSDRLQAAKLEALAEFAAGAGHEINNPVATISGRVQLLLKGETDPERRAALLSIGGQALRIRDMIGDLMLFGRPPQPRPERLDCREMLRAVADGLREEAAERRVELCFDAGEPVPVFADRVQLSIVIGSLIRNSIEALPDGGFVSIAARSAAHGGRNDALLTVTDFGVGLSDADREHLFDPFYSGRQAGRGLGFGLPKAWRIVKNHGGRIEVESVPHGPTTFTVTWPAEPWDAKDGAERSH
jgi:signal transduction histidine kinase